MEVNKWLPHGGESNKSWRTKLCAVFLTRIKENVPVTPAGASHRSGVRFQNSSIQNPITNVNGRVSRKASNSQLWKEEGCGEPYHASIEHGTVTIHL